MAPFTTKASLATELVGARPRTSGQVSIDENILDPELEGEIDKSVVDNPKNNPVDFTMTQSSPYDVISIP